MPKPMIDQLTEEIIALKLHSAPRKPIENPYPAEIINPEPIPAAVLIPLLRKGDYWHVLFIRRSANQHDPHSGQVAFPGGACDPGDGNVIETALREAQEEIGLKPHDVRVVGQLNQFYTITSYRVTPIVGVIPWPYTFHLATDEVRRAFTIPLEFLADENNRSVELRQMPHPHPPIPVIYFRQYDGEVLWGASARFILRLIETITHS